MDRVRDTRERRYRISLNLGWLACLVVGPYPIFQCGNYHGRVNAYREEHAQKLYYLEREAEVAREAGQGEIYYILLPMELKELQSSEERYGALTFVWAFVEGNPGTAFVSWRIEGTG